MDHFHFDLPAARCWIYCLGTCNVWNIISVWGLSTNLCSSILLRSWAAILYIPKSRTRLLYRCSNFTSTWLSLTVVNRREIHDDDNAGFRTHNTLLPHVGRFYKQWNQKTKLAWPHIFLECQPPFFCLCFGITGSSESPCTRGAFQPPKHIK